MNGEISSLHPRYRELDSLRGLAALLVVFFHLTMLREQSQLGFNVGATGVDLFFIISGFVIFRSVNNISSIKEFVINRFTRLYPTYWTCVSFTFILYFILHKISDAPDKITFSDYLGNLTMFQYYLKIPNIDDPYWTMIIEMLFYIFVAILFSLKQLKRIIPVGLIILVLLAIQNLLAGTNLWSSYTALQRAVPFLFFFPLFFSGIIFYKLSTETKNRFFYYLLIISGFTIQIFRTGGSAFVSYKESIVMTTIYFILFIFFVNKKLNFIIVRPFLFLGKISFALYLIHQYISTQVLLPFFLDTCHVNFWIAAFLTLTVVIILASLVTFYIEIPLGMRLNNFLRNQFKLPKRISHEKPIQKIMNVNSPNSEKKQYVALISAAIVVFILFYLYHSTSNPANNPVKHAETYSLKAWNNKFISADESHKNILIANRDAVTAREIFTLLHVKGNKYGICSYTHKFFSAELAHENEITASRDKVSDWETFSLIKLDSNVVAFKAANGKYLSPDEKSLQLVAKSDAIGKQEEFEMRAQ